LLVGLDLRSRQAAVLTNRRRMRRADDLVDLILRPDQGLPAPPKGGGLERSSFQAIT
jgi:hypothetical protein